MEGGAQEEEHHPSRHPADRALHRRRPWRHHRGLEELIRSPGFPPAQAPQWPILYLSLAEHSAKELLQSKRAWHQALAVVRAEREEDIKEFAEVLGAAAHAIDKLADIDKPRHWRLLEFILRWATARRQPKEHHALYQGVVEQVRPEHQDKIIDMSSKIRLTFEEALELKAQQRYEQGKAEGKAEEKAEGTARELETCRTNLMILESRFGSLSDELRQKVETSTDVEQLKAWFKQAFVITSPEELL